jgi:WD40 repeat protein
MRVLAYNDNVWSNTFYHHNSNLLVGGAGDGKILIWNLANSRKQEPTYVLEGEHGGVCCVAVSHDDRYIASACFTGHVVLWDAHTYEREHAWGAHDRSVTCVVWARNSSILASCSDDKTICMWGKGTESWEKVCDFAQGLSLQHSESVTCVGLNSDGALLVSGSKDQMVKIWDVTQREGVVKFTLRGHESEVLAVAFSPDDCKIVSGGGDAVVRVWDARSGTQMFVIQCGSEHGDPVRMAIWTNDGSQIICANDTAVCVWALGEVRVCACLCFLCGFWCVLRVCVRV